MQIKQQLIKSHILQKKKKNNQNVFIFATVAFKLMQAANNLMQPIIIFSLS